MAKINKVLCALALVLAAVLVFLYAMEYYDFTFIKRPSAEEGSAPPETTPPDTTSPPTTEPAVTEPPVLNPPSTGDTEQVIDPREFLDLDEAGLRGYYITSNPYSAANTIIAELRTKLEISNAYSIRKRTVNKETLIYEREDGEAILDIIPTEESRPTLEAYMGFILADNGETIDVYDPYGRWLNAYDPNVFEIAYKRDSEGNPLYRQLYYYKATTADGSQSAYFKDFNYFYMADNGVIYNSDYNNVTENRGVMFDYPASLGISTDGMGRICEYNRVIRKNLRGWLETFFKCKWTITRDGSPINNTTYSVAYPYSEGYACVADEDGLMYFIDKYGNKTFETKKLYWSSGDRYVVDRLLMPLDETTALGCYYFDHGLVKARRQIYDYYQLEDWNYMYVMSDEYVMLRTDGTEFPIPANYKVQSYSDGVILLEKNGKYGYMDYTGAWLNVPEYDDAEPFSEGLAACKKDGKWGMIDTTGKTVLPFIYDHIQSASSGVIVAHSSYGWNTYIKMTK